MLGASREPVLNFTFARPDGPQSRLEIREKHAAPRKQEVILEERGGVGLLGTVEDTEDVELEL